MEIAKDEDWTVRRERARVIGSQSLSLYRSLSLARLRAVSLLLACARSFVACRLDPQLPHQLSNMVRYGITCRQWPCFLFLDFFFGTRPMKREEEVRESKSVEKACGMRQKKKR